jgi:amino acid transporter
VLIFDLTLELTLVNLIGIQQSTVFTHLVTGGKLGPLVRFALVGLWFVAPANFNFEIVPSYGAASVGVVSLMYAFVGFEVAVIPGGEVKDPKRNFPFALLVGLAIVALLYISIQIVSIGTLPGLATSKTPLADAAANFMGPIGGLVIVAGASMSILGNLNVGLIGATRLLDAMGDRLYLPPDIAAIHPTMKTPYVSLFITATVILILTVQLSFVSALAMATITRLVVYASTCIALPIFRKKHETDKAAFSVPFGMTIPIIALLLIVWLLVSWATTTAANEGLPLVIAAVIGLILYFVSKFFTGRGES